MGSEKPVYCQIRQIRQSPALGIRISIALHYHDQCRVPVTKHVIVDCIDKMLRVSENMNRDVVAMEASWLLCKDPKSPPSLIALNSV